MTMIDVIHNWVELCLEDPDSIQGYVVACAGTKRMGWK